jgi:glyoxylase-like metal-dependent hydrolase (beta-lactamase superfamily II)
VEIIRNVHRIPGVSGVNVYLLLGQTLTLVDTGMPGSAEAILKYVHGLGHTLADLTRIVITHHHVDHTGSLAAIKERTQANVLAHPADTPYIAGERPRPGRQLYRMLSAVSSLGSVAVDVPIEDAETLNILSGATVIHVPGHTPGSVALHFPVERLLITGDAINHRGNQLSTPVELFTEDMGQAIASIRCLAKLSFETLCPGHGDPIVGGAAKQVRAMLREMA